MAKKAVIRRTNRELYLAKLSELSKNGEELVTNAKLRGALVWDESKYDSVKKQLKDEKSIIVSTGHGGRVGLADATDGNKALNIFVSYSHVDESLRTDLLKHLEPLKRLRLIEAWHDRELKPGDELGKSISANLNKSDIILLLISIDFINSSYCYDIELERAMELQTQGKAKVIPIILRDCLWKHSSFVDLMALPKDGKAITAWVDKDEAFVNVAEGIRQVAEQIRAKK